MSTPAYKAARAKEKQQFYEKLAEENLNWYGDRVFNLSAQLNDSVFAHLQRDTNQYLNVCSDAEYSAIANRAYTYLDQLAAREQKDARRKLVQQILEAEERQNAEGTAEYTPRR